jgi:hypothetical protein
VVVEGVTGDASALGCPSAHEAAPTRWRIRLGDNNIVVHAARSGPRLFTCTGRHMQFVATRQQADVTSPSPSPLRAGRAGTSTTRATKGGALQARFEILVRHTLGDRDVCARHTRRDIIRFVHHCTPLAIYDPYFFVFKTHRGPSGLFLSSTPPRSGSLGNYPQPVQIRHEYVMCDPDHFLISFADTESFTLRCLKPML